MLARLNWLGESRPLDEEEEPESDWLSCWVLSLSQSYAGSPTRSIVTPLQAHSISHATSLASQLFYCNHHSTVSCQCLRGSCRGTFRIREPSERQEWMMRTDFIS